MERAIGFGPATVANVAVGFDILGFALGAVGDRVTVSRTSESRVTVDAIRGVVTDLPREPERNTATVPLLGLLEDKRPGFGFRVEIDKGIALGSGMGGSAASAVAAVVAANRLLDESLSREEMLRYALAGETAATGAAHADNAAACLYGGMIAVVDSEAPRVLSLPLPPSILVILVHPHLQIETRAARSVLPEALKLTTHVRQSMRFCEFIAACYSGDVEGLRRSMEDLIAEPVRSSLIPGFGPARAAALDAGALGFAISGSGPSVFALATDPATARAVQRAVCEAFESAGVGCDSWVGPIETRGAYVMDDEGGK